MENMTAGIKQVGESLSHKPVVGSYPEKYQVTTVTKAGIHILIRSIKPEDTLLLQKFWEVLSPKTLYYRFSSSSKKLTLDLLHWLTEIDYHREIALVAIEPIGKEKRILGTARLTGSIGDNLAEIAVLVGDPWQGNGVGAKLLSQMILIALEKNIKSIWGLVLRENWTMLKLVRSLGFSVISDDPSSQVEIYLDLSIAGIKERLQAANSE